MSHTDPVEAVRAAYARIGSTAARHVWIGLRPEDDAVADARAVRARLRAGEPLPLAGLVFAVKDNIDVAGMPTTAAHPAFATVPSRTASAVTRLTDAGAVLVGKTNLDQLATGLVGTRSPYGAVSSAVDPGRVAGGSSSGSGAAVGLGLVDFALGTDTAGSGRVPAAFNGVVGLKPTLGLVAKDGVVPACPSYDTVSVFAQDVVSGARVLAVAVGPSADDPGSRAWPADAPQGVPRRPVVAVPRDEDLAVLPPGARAAFDAAVARVEAQGATLRTVDLTPFLEAGRLLYDGGLVAERAWSYGDFLAEHPDDADPSVAAIAAAAAAVPGVRVVADQQRLRTLTAQARAALRGTHALVVPTAPVHPTHEQVAADPIGLNSTIGTFTNFVNLMDMAAVAVPAGRVDGEGLFGVTFVVPAFHDQVAVDLAARFLGESVPALLGAPGTDVAVFGAHLRGEPLNVQLEALGGRYVRDVATARTFRMLLVEGDVERPAVVRGEPGASIPGELWRLSPQGLAGLLTSVAAPLALGPVELADGSTVVGFVAAPSGTEPDITHLGGWRGYRHARPLAASV
ncbi:allophanate hydrolase [Cellulosimicrobium marinum]|uniref:allophanate hydrolase n=1 Tax=Cellulosimicrobium marinum TaxID=1638992 RepID=UPI001E2956D8|nr:allophanate hydrolase [Cellulosimicrobium marinum]MCB7135316.1 allophanate hydrolase [Cellulosimicrobium marinum]